MVVKRSTISIGSKTIDELKGFIGDELENNISAPKATISLIYAAINTVNHAIKEGIISEKARQVTHATAKKQGGFYGPSGFLLYLALYYKNLGMISDELFEQHQDNLPSLIKSLNLEHVELERSFLPELSDREKEIHELEMRLRILKAEEKLAQEKKNEK